jgi:hypothetical protein
MWVRALGAVALAVGLAACGAERQTWENTFHGQGVDAFLVDDDFTCMTDWPQVERSHYFNVFGHTEEALTVASVGGGPFPVGTIVQLFPTEAMVKRGSGFSPATHDWEYLTLDVDSGHTIITQRGTLEPKNIVGTCQSCHAHGDPSFDFVCGDTHGCAALPGFIVDRAKDAVKNDPRCR